MKTKKEHIAKHPPDEVVAGGAHSEIDDLKAKLEDKERRFKKQVKSGSLQNRLHTKDHKQAQYGE